MNVGEIDLSLVLTSKDFENQLNNTVSKSVGKVQKSINKGVDNSVKQATGKVQNAFDPIQNELSYTIQSATNDINNEVSSTFSVMTDGLSNSVEVALNDLEDEINDLDINFNGINYESLTQGLGTVTSDVLNSFEEMEQGADQLGDSIDDITVQFNQSFDNIPEFLGSTENAFDGAIDGADRLGYALHDLNDSLTTGGRNLERSVENIGNDLQDAVHDVDNAVDGVVDSVQDLDHAVDGIGDSVDGAVNDIADSLNDIEDSVDNVENSLANAVDGINDSTEGLADNFAGIGDTIGEGMNAGGDAVEGLIGKVGKLGSAIATAFAVGQLSEFVMECTEIGSDLAEVSNVVDTVFTNLNNKVVEFSRNATSQYGMSETMAMEYVGTLGSMARAFDFTEQEAYDMATTLTGLTADVSSFYNLDHEEAYTKLKSVFTGETESLKDLGVVMTQTALDQYALANGFGKTTSQMTEQEKTALRYQFVLDKLKFAQGDFAKTSGEWANQMRIFSLQWETLKGTLGRGFIAILSPVLVMLNKIIARIIDMANIFVEAINRMSSVFSGFSFGGSAKVNTSNVPKLAKGGYVKKNNPQLVMIGDNIHEGEIVAPESKLQNAVSEGIRNAVIKTPQQTEDVTNSSKLISEDIQNAVTKSTDTAVNTVMNNQSKSEGTNIREDNRNTLRNEMTTSKNVVKDVKKAVLDENTNFMQNFTSTMYDQKEFDRILENNKSSDVLFKELAKKDLSNDNKDAVQIVSDKIVSAINNKQDNKTETSVIDDKLNDVIKTQTDSQSELINKVDSQKEVDSKLIDSNHVEKNNSILNKIFGMKDKITEKFNTNKDVVKNNDEVRLYDVLKDKESISSDTNKETLKTASNDEKVLSQDDTKTLNTNKTDSVENTSSSQDNKTSVLENKTVVVNNDVSQDNESKDKTSIIKDRVLLNKDNVDKTSIIKDNELLGGSDVKTTLSEKEDNVEYDKIVDKSTKVVPKLATGGYVKKNDPRLVMIGDNMTEGEIVAPESKLVEAVKKGVGASSNKETKVTINAPKTSTSSSSKSSSSKKSSSSSKTALLGGDEINKLGDNTKEISNNTNNLSKVIKKVGNTARKVINDSKKALMGFDELNVLNIDEDDNELNNLDDTLSKIKDPTSNLDKALSKLKDPSTSGLSKLTDSLPKANTSIGDLTKGVDGLGDSLKGLSTDGLSGLGSDSLAGLDTGLETATQDTDQLNGNLEQTGGRLDTLNTKAGQLQQMFKQGFELGLGEVNFDDIINHAKGIMASMKIILTDPNLTKAVDNFWNSLVFNVGQILGSLASVGLTAVELLLGGMDLYLAKNKGFIIDFFTSEFNALSDIFDTIGDTFRDVADIFSVFRSDEAKNILAGFIEIFANSFMGLVELTTKLGRDLLDAITRPIRENKDKIKDTLQGLLGVIEPIVTGIADFVTNSMIKINEMYDEHIKPLIDTIGSTLSDLFGLILDNINTYVMPMLQYVGDEVKKVFDEYISPVMEQIIDIIGQVADILGMLIEYGFKPMGEFIINTLVPVLGVALAGAFVIVVEALKIVFDVISNLLKILQGLLDFIIGAFTNDWDKAWKGLGTVVQGVFGTIDALTGGMLTKLKNFALQVGEWFGKAWKFMVDTFKGAGEWAKGVGKDIENGFKNCMKGVGDWFSKQWEGIKGVFKGAGEWFGKIFGNARETVINQFKGLPEWLNNMWKNTTKSLLNIGGKFGNMISGAIKSAVNYVLALCENKINGFISLFNGIIKYVNKLPGVNIGSMKKVSIPRFANGGYVKANTPQLAIVGDNKREGEIIAPESKIAEAVNTGVSLALEKVVNMIQQNQGTQQTGDIVIPVSIGQEHIDTIIINSQRRQNLRSGGRV